MARRKQLLEDIEYVKGWSEENETFNIKDIRFEDETLYFVYDNGNKKQKESFVFHLTDYPDGMNMLFASTSSDPRMCSGTLQKVLKDISKEYNAKFGIDDSEEMQEEGEEEEEGGDEEGGMEEEGEGWEEEYATEMAYKEHKELTREVQNYQTIFGKDSISTRPMPLLETVDVEMNIAYSDILDVGVCAAWGIDSEFPIMLRITFSADYFLDAKDEPKIEFYQQRNSKKAFRLRYQLEAVLNKFIKETWPSSSGKKIHTEEYIAPKKGKGKESADKDVGVSGWMGKVFGKDGKKKDDEMDTDPSRDAEISSLVEMGFSIGMARNALEMTANLEEATNLLLTDPESCKKSNSTSSKNAKSPTGASRVDELFKSPEKALSNDHKKVQVTSKYGFLVMVASFLRQRLPSLNNFCVICDQPHVFAHGNMLKPAVCSRELCCFSFQQLGVGADAADDIATGAEVVDLLVCFATVAAKSPRNNVIFEPYPTIFDPKDPKKMILDPKNKEFTKVIDILTKFPSVEMMSQAKDFTDMKKQMDKAHQHAYSLLQWIITSNRSHVVKMNTDKQIKSMVTPHQYLLLSAPPEKEAKFRQLREQHGSVFAFHGSSIENWHSILRQGLKNASGTKLQMNGAAYGAGIYLSPHSATSFGYCRMYNTNSTTTSGGNRFLDSTNMNCIAICEVINKDIKKNGSIWVMPHEDYVVTRFFFVYTSANTGNANNCNCETQQFTNEILQAIKSHSYG